MIKHFEFLTFFAATGLTVTLAGASHAPVSHAPVSHAPVSHAPASQAQAPITGNSEMDAQKKIQDYLNAITTLTASFNQNNPDGSKSSGRFYLQRSKTGFGKMRLEYNPPVKLLLVSNGDLLMQHDLESDQVSSYSIDSTPASLLLQKHIDFSRDATVRKIQLSGNSAILTLARSKEDDGSTLTLTFSLTPTIALKEWTVLDSQGNNTHVTLGDVRLGTQLAQKLFVVNR